MDAETVRDLTPIIDAFDEWQNAAGGGRRVESREDYTEFLADVLRLARANGFTLSDLLLEARALSVVS